MKKTYIAPKAVAYNVNAKCQTLSGSIHDEEGNGIQLVKGQNSGQLENESVSIWDLY